MPFVVSGRVSDAAVAKHTIPAGHRRFSLAFSQEAGWDDPESPVLAALRSEASSLGLVYHNPIPQPTRRIVPVFDDAPGESWVMSSVAAVLWTITDSVKWEVTEPVGTPAVEDPTVVY